MNNFYHALALLVSICAVCAYLNQRFLKWPQVLAMNIMGAVIAATLMILGNFGLFDLKMIESFVRHFNFEDVVLHLLLGPLLFAGAKSVNTVKLKMWAKPIAALATVGVAIAAFVIGGVLWCAAQAFGFDLPFIWCVLFGALISPTDPIAALAIVKQANAPKAMEIKLVGESLFNDATGVMMFLVVLAIINTGELSTSLLAHELFVAPVGAAVLGALLGWFATKALPHIDHHPTTLLITLALALGTYALAEAIHVSAPIAVVAAGLVVGHMVRKGGIVSEETREHVHVFWEGLDEVINALLFVLIGLELVLVETSWKIMLFGVVAWATVLLGRWVAVSAVLRPMKRRGGLGAGTTKVMVWGGLRGGISLALALSIPNSAQSELLVAITFVVVAMSSAIQGMTLHRVIPKHIEADKNDPEIAHDDSVNDEDVISEVNTK